MNYHIVRTNEKIESIINLYNLTIDEIKDLNTHISNWHNLIPGTRLKLPSISEALTNEINDIEPFIEDYYPRIDFKKYESKDEEIDADNTFIIEEKTSSVESVNQTEDVKELEEEKNEKSNEYYNSINLPPSYKYYYNPYDYYRYLRRKSNKK